MTTDAMLQAIGTVRLNSPTLVPRRAAFGRRSGGYYYTDVFCTTANERGRCSCASWPQEGVTRRGFKNNQWAGAATSSARNATIYARARLYSG